MTAQDQPRQESSVLVECLGEAHIEVDHRLALGIVTDLIRHDDHLAGDEPAPTPGTRRSHHHYANAAPVVTEVEWRLLREMRPTLDLGVWHTRNDRGPALWRLGKVVQRHIHGPTSEGSPIVADLDRPERTDPLLNLAVLVVVIAVGVGV